MYWMVDGAILGCIMFVLLILWFGIDFYYDL